jgi:hypothetical protein
MYEGMQQLGKWLIVAGGCILLFGVLILLMGRFGHFRIPGDLEFGSKNWKVYIPLASCLVISIILTLILWIIIYLRR